MPILGNGQPVGVTNHLTRLSLEVKPRRFIRRHRAYLWFLYLALATRRTRPLQLICSTVRALCLDRRHAKRRAYAAQVSLMDDAIGAGRAALRDPRQTERTLVFFFSDNGGPVTVKWFERRAVAGGQGPGLDLKAACGCPS